MLGLSLNEKRKALLELNLGDTVRLTNNQEYEFIRVKQSKFIGKRNGAMYDIGIINLMEIVEKSDGAIFDASNLKEGDLFFTLNNQHEPIVFRFKYMINSNRVSAENPFNEMGYTVDCSMIKGMVSRWM